MTNLGTVKQRKNETFFLSIWPTNACNRRCRYCFYEDSDLWNLKRQDMTTEVADAVIDFINSGKVEGVSFFGAEPLLNWPIMKRILARAWIPVGRPRRRVWNVTTNDTLLDEEKLEYLDLHQVHVNLSFDGTKETQDKWRDGTYDIIRAKLPELLKYPSLHVLKTLADPTTVYKDVKHIKDLGFKSVFINLLDPFGHDTYEGYDPEEFKQQYRQVIALDGPDFRVADYRRWRDLIDPKKPKKIGCGFVNRGLCVDWAGNLWPCHQGPSLPEEFIIGDIW
ncbi:MAG: radical SAM protein, partial [Candidatus Thorarchaeota archaeon]